MVIRLHCPLHPIFDALRVRGSCWYLESVIFSGCQKTAIADAWFGVCRGFGACVDWLGRHHARHGPAAAASTTATLRFAHAACGPTAHAALSRRAPCLLRFPSRSVWPESRSCVDEQAPVHKTSKLITTLLRRVRLPHTITVGCSPYNHHTLKGRFLRINRIHNFRAPMIRAVS